jgi:4-hydroxy-4-methyl-2-oxoglutarate aldolase
VRERFLGIYTAALADILDARGLRHQTLPTGIRPLAPGTKLAGQAFTVSGRPSDAPEYDKALRKVLRMLGEVPAGHVAVYACEHEVSAHLGELSVTSLKSRGVAGCVLDGGCRDVRFILDEGFPVFCAHTTPEDSTWRWELEAKQVSITVGSVHIEPGDWVVGDDDGVVVVPRAIAESVLAEAEKKAATESQVRVAVRDGMTPLEAYERYGTF